MLTEEFATKMGKIPMLSSRTHQPPESKDDDEARQFRFRQFWTALILLGRGKTPRGG